MKKEIWQDIEGYEGKYQVSNWGRVKSLNYHRGNREQILKPIKDKYGYFVVVLYKNGKRKMFKVHRLVAMVFLPNILGFEEVNHKDENKENNFVGTPENDFKESNLEWCDHKYNNNYGTRTERASEKNTNGKRSKPILQLTLDCKLVKEWPSTREADRCGYNHGDIVACCRGKQKTHKGYIWKYKE